MLFVETQVSLTKAAAYSQYTCIVDVGDLLIQSRLLQGSLSRFGFVTAAIIFRRTLSNNFELFLESFSLDCLDDNLRSSIDHFRGLVVATNILRWLVTGVSFFQGFHLGYYNGNSAP